MTPQETTGYTWLFYWISAIAFLGSGVFIGIIFERIDRTKEIIINIDTEA